MTSDHEPATNADRITIRSGTGDILTHVPPHIFNECLSKGWIVLTRAVDGAEYYKITDVGKAAVNQ